MLYPGTLSYHQGLDIAIRALARIKDQAPHAELHIYGQGDQLNSLVRLANDLGLEGRVQFHEPVPLTEMARIMENADLGIVPKRTDGFGNEAFSTKTLEFMALGVAVIVSDSAIDRYYFNDSVVKFFRGNDDKDLAQSMLDLIRDPELRERQVRHANEFIKRFDWDVRKDRYLELVDTLVRPA
jgi:glycosyltransferase involved in cell wall biosynthesis